MPIVGASSKLVWTGALEPAYAMPPGVLFINIQPSNLNQWVIGDSAMSCQLCRVPCCHWHNCRFFSRSCLIWLTGCHCHCSVEWGPKILKHPATREVRGSSNQVLMRGMPAAIGMLHGPVVSIVPHATTGPCCNGITNVRKSFPCWMCRLAGSGLFASMQPRKALHNVSQCQTLEHLRAR